MVRPARLLAGTGVLGLALGSGLVVLGGAPAWSSGPTVVSDVVDPSPVRASQPAAVELLQAAVRAEARLSYSGTTIIRESGIDGPATTQVQVTHRPGEGTTLVVLVAGRPVRTDHVPDGLVGNPTVLEAFEAGVSETKLLTTNYRVELGGKHRVAGRSTQEVLALLPDGVVAASYEVDRLTGLLLARAWFGGETVQAQFASIRFSRTSSSVKSTVQPASVSAATMARYRLLGWIARDQLPGGFRLFDIKLERYSGANALHLVYSDGLATISLFEQEGHLDPRHLTGFSQGTVGTTTVWWRSGRLAQRVWQSGGLVVTVMGEVPTSVLEGVVRVIPGSRVDDGVKVTDRLRRGVHRVLTALHLTAG